MRKALMLLNSIMSGMSSRMFQEVRERLGLVCPYTPIHYLTTATLAHLAQSGLCAEGVGCHQKSYKRIKERRYYLGIQ